MSRRCFFEGERVDEGTHVAHRKRHHDVYVMSQSGFAVQNSGGAPGDEIRDPQFLEPEDERCEEARFLHAGRSFACNR